MGLFDVLDDMKCIIDWFGKVCVLGVDFKYKFEFFEDKDWEREWMDNFYFM